MARTIPIHLDRPRDIDVFLNDGDQNSRDEIERDHVGSLKTRLFRLFRCFAGMAILGVALAVTWHYSADRLGPFGQWSLAFATQLTTGSGSQQQLQDQLAGAVREIEALKKSIADAAATQQQMAANIASLQAGQQELRQRVTSMQPPPYWYSDPAKLKPRISFSNKAAARARLDQTVALHDGGPPLPLSSPSDR